MLTGRIVKVFYIVGTNSICPILEFKRTNVIRPYCLKPPKICPENPKRVHSKESEF